MTDKKYTPEELEKMADSMLKESASGKPGKGTLDEKAIASLPAAALLSSHEKLKELFAKGKKKGKLDAGELSDVLDEMDLESDQMDSIYDSLEQLGIEVGTEDFLTDLPDDDEPAMEEIAEIDLATDTPESLQQETADGLTLEGMLGTEAPEEKLVEKIALREAIDQLPEKERMTILLRYFKGLTQEQTARVLGVSQVQISRLERRGLERLRKSFGP